MMMTDGDREREAAKSPGAEDKQADELAAMSDSDNMAELESVSTDDMEGENIPPGQEISDAIDKEILDDVYKAAEEPPEADQNDDVVEEVQKQPVEEPITHLKSPVNNRVFEANADLMKRKDLIPCDENGKQVVDHRRL